MKKIILFLYFALLLNFAAASADEKSGPSVDVAVVNAALDEVQSAQSIPPPTSVATGPTLVTEIFKLKFIRPQDVVDRLRDKMGTAPGGVLLHDKSGEVEVTAPVSVMEQMKGLIAELDQEREILLEARVVQVDLNDEHRSGINWSAIVSDFKNFVAYEDNRSFSTGTVSKDDYEVLLDALQTVGEARVYPAQTIKIYSGQNSDLRLKAFSKDVTVTLIPQNVQQQQPPERQDRYSARLLLSVLVTGNDMVDIVVATTDLEGSKIMLKKDNIGVIGGIFTQTKLESTKKFPFLGDLPLFGVVFRDQSREVHRLENIIFLTPNVATAKDSKN